MKKAILIFTFLLLASVNISYSQFGNSKAIVQSYSASTFIGRFATFTSGNCNSIDTDAYVGVIPCNLDGVANTPFYCLDLCTPIGIGDTVKDSASTIPQAIYITTTYYPARTSYSGKLPNNNDEACAVQFAIWHFRNNLDIDGIISVGSATLATIKARANAIIADVIANGGSSVNVSTIAIKEGTQSDQFYIETKDTAGNPIAVSNIQLTITGIGTLSTYTENTNAGGVSPDVTVLNGDNGDLIKATATLQIPGGVTYSGRTFVKQLLVLGRTTTGLRTAQITYGALPVELSSFTASINNRDVELNWNTTTETNNAGFEVERKLSGTEAWQELGFVSGNGFTNSVSNYSFTDRNLSEGTYNYRLKQVDYNGNFEYFNLNSEIEIGTPNSYNLSQNYPNPFNPSTKINFEMAKEGNVSIKVFDYTGKEISTLVNGFRSAGYYTIDFNAINLSSGIYFYRMETNNFTKVMKMSLIK